MLSTKTGFAHSLRGGANEKTNVDPHASPYRRGNMGFTLYILFLEYETMKTYTVKIKHISTGNVYSVPVLARSRSEAESKAGQWPYSTDAYIVLTGA